MFSYKNHTQRKPFIYNGLVGAWNFNNGNSKYIYDYSGYGNTSIFLGPNPSVGWGEKSKSLNLNGDYDFFEVIGEKLPPVLDLNNLTFSTWINIKSEKNASIIGNLTDEGGWLLSTILQNGLRLKFSYNKNYIEAISDFIVPTNKWIFISVSFDNKNYVKFYLNGLEKKSFFYIKFGLFCSGSSIDRLIYENFSKNNIFCNGESKILLLNEQIANGGAINSGVCFNETIYNIISSGGLVVGGNSVVGFFYEQIAIGGSIAGGIGLETAVYYSFGDGGLISSVGSSQTFYSTVNVDGGCSLGGYLH